MNPFIKKSFLIMLPVAFSLILFLSFAKPTSLKVEDKFGTFSLNCKTFEKGSAVGAYGFGLAYCNNENKELAKVIRYDEINSYIQFLKENGLFAIKKRVVQIKTSLENDDNEMYFNQVEKYIKEIESLTSSEKEIVLSFFKI
ncbi:MAG TPA: hypothetical protein VKY82_01390 [Flavobacterium sp.]|nr:hypothetical protein [Flavobacterium sp.]